MYQLDLFSSVEQHPIKKELREYQRSAIDSVHLLISEGKKSICLALATGAGKSLTVANLLVELRATPLNCIALVPRRKLKKQLRDEFKAVGLNTAMVHTAQYLTDKKLFGECKYANLKYIILDECHELAWWQPVEKLRQLNPDATVIGLTATPDRSSRKEFIEDKFESIIYPISFGELVNMEYLCNPRYFSYGNQLNLNELSTDVDGIFVQEQLDKQCEKQHFNESIVKNLVTHNIQERRSIIFCSSIKQSKKLTQMLCDAGISTIHIDGGTSETEQESAIAKVANGEISALSCAKLLIAGFDEPRIDTVILATATNSRQNLVQMCGRGSRIHPEKNGEFWVFDFGDNFARLKIGLKQKFPYKCRYDAQEATPALMKACPNCGHLVYGFVMVCPECGEIFPKKEKPVIDLQDMNIVEVEADLQDMYHIKQIRKIVRDCYSQFELPFVSIANYLSKHRIRNITQVISPVSLLGAIFKHKSLQNMLDLVWYVDYHTHRLDTKKLYKHEEQYLQKLKGKSTQSEIKDWIDTIATFPEVEFGGKYLKVKAITKYVGSGRWQDILGVLDFDSKDNMITAYKSKWQHLNAEIAQHLDFHDGQIDPDAVAEKLQNSNNPDLKDLHNRIAVLEWAYRYVNLLYKS